VLPIAALAAAAVVTGGAALGAAGLIGGVGTGVGGALAGVAATANTIGGAATGLIGKTTLKGLATTASLIGVGASLLQGTPRMPSLSTTAVPPQEGTAQPTDLPQRDGTQQALASQQMASRTALETAAQGRSSLIFTTSRGLGTSGEAGQVTARKRLLGA